MGYSLYFVLATFTKRWQIGIIFQNKNTSKLNWTTSPKSYAELMINDSALGCPLIYDLGLPQRPFACWKTIENYLERIGCFENEK